MVCQKVRWSAADDIVPGAVLKIRESAVRGSLHDKSPHSPPASTVLKGGTLLYLAQLHCDSILLSDKAPAALCLLPD